MIGMYELLKADAKITISEELVNDFKAINASLAEACGLALRQPTAGRQYVLMSDASFSASGYALMIEDNDDKKILSKKNVRLSRLQIPRVLSVPTQNVIILQRMSCSLPRFSRVQSHPMGNKAPNASTNRQ